MKYSLKVMSFGLGPIRLPSDKKQCQYQISYLITYITVSYKPKRAQSLCDRRNLVSLSTVAGLRLGTEARDSMIGTSMSYLGGKNRDHFTNIP